MKISLAINSKNPVEEYLDKLLNSADGFDEVILYIDGDDIKFNRLSHQIDVIGDGQSRDIKDGFNYAIAHATGNWICSFCDDDFFIQPALFQLLDAMRNGDYADDADIIHFPVLTGNGSWGHAGDFSESDIRNCNLIPHGSFFRKEVWERLGGYRTNEATDWNFWIRAKAAGFRFKGWADPIYFFRMGTPRSAWLRQVEKFGIQEIKRIVNVTV